MSGEDKRAFLTRLQGLKGKPCWGVVAGPGTGSIVALDFGDKIALARPIDNPHLSAEQRSFEGELSLYVECAWRVDDRERVVCGSTDANDEGGPMLLGLRSLVGRTVESVVLRMPAMDLTLGFKGGITLNLFCDQTEKDVDNYCFFAGTTTFVVGAKGALSLQEKKK